MSSTIAAISTPQGIGALGIIRLSGPEAIVWVDTLFKGRMALVTAKPRTLHFGTLQWGEEVIDEVVVSLFKAPHSYTGEDIVEISCHGSAYILQRTMEALLNAGAIPAGPGEFSMRAFSNGKLDLSQAEAVGDLIAAESQAAHDAALYQMRGGYSQKIESLRTRLLNFASLIELELDFAEEDVEFADRGGLLRLVQEMETEIQQLIDSFALGNVIKSGIRVVIAGRPNAGKSTLLNALLQEEKALVSEIPGTTRDVIEDTITIHGIQFRFMDTAGLRLTEDALERMGIERTRQKMTEAAIIIYLFDAGSSTDDQVMEDVALLPPNKTILIIGNKADNASGTLPEKFPCAQLFISARYEEGLDALRLLLAEGLHLPQYHQGETVVTNIRHLHAFNQSMLALQNIKSGFADGIPTDLIATDIRQALHALGTITGKISSDEILGNIFGKFCIGK